MESGWRTTLTSCSSSVGSAAPALRKETLAPCRVTVTVPEAVTATEICFRDTRLSAILSDSRPTSVVELSVSGSESIG